MKRMLVVCALVGTMLVPAALAADPVAGGLTRTRRSTARRSARPKGVEAFQDAVRAPRHTEQDERVREVRVGDQQGEGRQGRRRREDRGRGRVEGNGRLQESSSADNATKFAQDYKNFGQCVKSQEEPELGVSLPGSSAGPDHVRYERSTPTTPDEIIVRTRRLLARRRTMPSPFSARWPKSDNATRLDCRARHPHGVTRGRGRDRP